jgi:DNA-binding MarR family transcriptional regulator/GNAT superfamily N-acetyltransferase
MPRRPKSTGASPVSGDPRVSTIREFNRFYTKKIGVLRAGLLESPFSLVQVRVLYEIAQRQSPTATEIRSELDLDAGYLSRILRGFEQQGFIERQRSAADARRAILGLTRRGRAAFASLNERADDEIRTFLHDLSADEQDSLVQSMRTIEALLGERDRKVPYVLRPHRPGDLGWIIYRQGVLYATEYGWNGEYEALAATIIAAFIKNFDAARERCWIAERDGANVGAVFLVSKSKTVAQLRLLHVEPSARGLGIGTRLVDECTTFARQVGYHKIVLWTNDVLRSARRIYEAAGYRLVGQEPHHSFGKDLVGQTWELDL